MALDHRHAVPTPVRGDPSAAGGNAALYNLLLVYEEALSELQELLPQPADRAPQKPRIGMIRRNILPWDPLGSATEGWVRWDGDDWLAF